MNFKSQRNFKERFECLFLLWTFEFGRKNEKIFLTNLFFKIKIVKFLHIEQNTIRQKWKNMKRHNASAYVHMKCDTPPPTLYGAVYMLKYDGNIMIT